MALASESVEITISTISISLRLQDSNEDRETDHAGSVLRTVNNFFANYWDFSKVWKIFGFFKFFQNIVNVGIFKNIGNFGFFKNCRIFQNYWKLCDFSKLFFFSKILEVLNFSKSWKFCEFSKSSNFWIFQKSPDFGAFGILQKS